MKTAIKLFIVIMLTMLLSIVGFFTIKTKDYWVTYFEIKKNKIPLRTEKYLDSLVYVINNQDIIYKFREKQIVDSLNNVISKRDEEIQRNLEFINAQKQIIYELQHKNNK